VGGTCLQWAFNTNGFLGMHSAGICQSSKRNCSRWDTLSLPSGSWGSAEYAEAQTQCHALGCTYANGTDAFGVCCDMSLLWGVSVLMLLYALAITILAAYYLTNRDQRMREKLERTLELTNSGDRRHAHMAQREFALHWELANVAGTTLAYVTGKTWNEVVVGRGAMWATYKSEESLMFSVATTIICVVMVSLEATGKLDQLLGALTRLTRHGLAMCAVQLRGAAGGGAMDSPALEMVSLPHMTTPGDNDDRASL
jgi:hypothetical protein